MHSNDEAAQDNTMRHDSENWVKLGKAGTADTKRAANTTTCESTHAMEARIEGHARGLVDVVVPYAGGSQLRARKRREVGKGSSLEIRKLLQPTSQLSSNVGVLLDICLIQDPEDDDKIIPDLETLLA